MVSISESHLQALDEAPRLRLAIEILDDGKQKAT